jgi:hypothetical protein
LCRHLQNSFGPAVGQPYWIGEEHGKDPQTAAVAELSAIDNPHETEACFPLRSNLIPFPYFDVLLLEH